jgi:hypothetical protein
MINGMDSYVRMMRYPPGMSLRVVSNSLQIHITSINPHSSLAMDEASELSAAATSNIALLAMIHE